MKQKDYSIILGDMGRNWWKHLDSIDSIVFSTFEDNVPSKDETHMAHNALTSILEMETPNSPPSYVFRLGKVNSMPENPIFSQ